MSALCLSVTSFNNLRNRADGDKLYKCDLSSIRGWWIKEKQGNYFRSESANTQRSDEVFLEIFASTSDFRYWHRILPRAVSGCIYDGDRNFDEHASSQGSHGAKGAKEAKDLALGKAKMPRD
jgi:hypothetical protein